MSVVTDSAMSPSDIVILCRESITIKSVFSNIQC